ncbi:MAG: Spy/CpxP family protein refolding chaperone [Ramlibacter sp.]|jgi:protein CpxP|nr:Spy/CpxP family protein refolding chaperone [Ramlibacter sp.]
MRPWIKRTLYGLFGATIVLGGITACGHRVGHHGMHASAEDQAKFRTKMVERVADKLELNADQKAKLGVLADKLQAQRAALQGKAANPRAEVEALVAGDKFDRARAQALVSEKTAAITTGSPEVIAAAGDFYDSLTPAQQTKVREFMQSRGGWRRG